MDDSPVPAAAYLAALAVLSGAAPGDIPAAYRTLVRACVGGVR